MNLTFRKIPEPFAWHGYTYIYHHWNTGIMAEIEPQVCQICYERSTILGLFQITSANGSDSCFQLFVLFIISMGKYENKHLWKL